MSPSPASPPRRCPSCNRAVATIVADEFCPACLFGSTDLATPSESQAAPVENRVPVSASLLPIHGFTVTEEIARGGMGIVYRARQWAPEREVALKVLLPFSASSRELRDRFQREAQALSELEHPAILPIFGMGEHDGLPWFTMKFCAGGSLAPRVASYRGKWREIAALVATLADAVQHAHERGVLHRDLKPGNILFDETGRPFVGDFGLAKAGHPRGPSLPVTQAHAVMGTRGYLAPELLRAGAGAATQAADVFGLAAILHELLAGAPPAENPTAMPVAPLRNVPRDLAVVAAKGLAPEPADRYATAAAFAADLRAWLDGKPIAARPVSGVAQLVAWARRNPALAALAAALIFTATGAGVALALKNRELRRAVAHAESSLADALVAQARAVRQSGREGQRRESLRLLGRAARIDPSAAARDEAAAALALPDWDERVERQPWIGSTAVVVPSPDFSRVLTDDGKGSFSLRETATGRESWAWRGPQDAVSRAVFSRDGRWVALRLRDDSVHVLAADDGRPVLALTGRPYAFKSAVREYGQDMDFSPDGARLAVTRPEGGVTFHRLPGGAADGEWAAPEWVTTIAFSPDGAQLAAGGGKEAKDNVLAVIDAATGRTLTQQKTARRVDLLVWSSDGRWLATRLAGGLAEVRAVANLALRSVVPDRGALHGHFLPDGKRLLLTEQVGQTRLWEIDQGRLLLAKLDGGRPGNWFAGEPLTQWRSYSEGPVLLTSLRDSPVLRTSDAEPAGASVTTQGGPVAVSADGRWLAVGMRAGGVLLDTTGRRERIVVRFGQTQEAGTLRLDVAGSAVWVALRESGLWRHGLPRDAAGEWGPPEPGELIDQEPGFFCADLHAPTGRLALVRPLDGVVKVIDVRTRTAVARWLHIGAWSAAFSPDGARLAVNAAGPGEHAATVHDALSGAIVFTLGAAPGDHIAWSPDGRWIYAGSEKRRGALWRTADWTPGPSPMARPDDHVHAAAFSRDGRWLALVGGDRHVRLVEPETGRTLVKLTAPEAAGWVPGLAFDARDRLWVVSLEGRVQVWDVPALRRELGALKLDWAGK